MDRSTLAGAIISRVAFVCFRPITYILVRKLL